MDAGNFRQRQRCALVQVDILGAPDKLAALPGQRLPSIPPRAATPACPSRQLGKQGGRRSLGVLEALNLGLSQPLAQSGKAQYHNSQCS